MKKEIWILIILAVIMVVLFAFLIFVPAKKSLSPQINGIGITSPKVNEEISSPLKITGTVNGNGWGGFEGQVGTVKLLDDKGNQIGMAILTAITDWMSPPIGFQTYLQFSSDRDQAGKLVFTNENPSGLPNKNREFIMPVKIKKGSGEIMKVKAYFNNNIMDQEISCNKVFAIERDVPKTTAVARAALDQLLIGLTNAEKDSGFFTSINSGVKIQSLTIENGTAKVDFDEQLERGVGGSCKVSAIRAQITETLEQFSTVKNVIISINGRTEDILQP
jgi:hypothetical protein